MEYVYAGGGLLLFFLLMHIWAYIRCPGHRFFDW